MADRRPDERVWPRPLRPGDLVVVVAPSGPTESGRLEPGLRLLRSWGLTVRLSPAALCRHPGLPYLSAADVERAADLTTAWAAPEVAAVFTTRGGYGAQRMVDLVDFAALRAAGPKHLVGYSDTTALHARIGRELGQVTLHGPALGSAGQLADWASAEQLRRMLMQPPVPGAVLAAGPTLVPGHATGRLAGGNLSLLAAEVGCLPRPVDPTVVLLEDTGEEGYRIDRMLTQLIRSGWLDSTSGVLLGEFTGSGDDELVRRVLADRLDGLGVPVVRVAVGHGDRNLTLPLGARVRMEADSLAEPGLILLAGL